MAARAERRLKAILAAEGVGYGRLTGTEKASAIARSKTLRRELVEPLIGQYRGRIVKLIRDGVLVEFASAVDAVACAVAVQNGMAKSEADVAEHGRMQHRIGINVGSINVQGDDILDDEADDAARLATVAEPGGICIARPVYDEVKSELKLPYEHHKDWMYTALMSTKTPDSWPRTMDLIEVSAVRIGAAAITGQSTDLRPTGLFRHIRRLLDRRVR